MDADMEIKDSTGLLQADWLERKLSRNLKDLKSPPTEWLDFKNAVWEVIKAAHKMGYRPGTSRSMAHRAI
jgi:hypothetical protein